MRAGDPPIANARSRFIQLLRSPSAGGFALRLVLLWSPMVALVVLRPIRQAIEEPIKLAYAHAVSLAFELLGVGHVREGVELHYAGNLETFRIDAACTGYAIFWFFVGAVLAFPATWRARAGAIVGGMAVLFGLNVVRIVSLYYVRVHYPQWFDEVHLVIWQSLVVVLVGVFWYGWASTRPADAPAQA